MPSLGAPELLIILAVVIVVFGVGKLPEVGGALGKGIKEFRRSAKDDGDDTPEPTRSETPTAAAPSAPANGSAPAASERPSTDETPAEMVEKNG